MAGWPAPHEIAGDRPAHVAGLGDGTAAAKAVLAGIPPTGLIGYGLAYGVFCREDAAFTDPAAILAAHRDALPDLPTEVLSLEPQGPRFIDECGVWNAAGRTLRCTGPPAATCRRC